MTERYDEEQLLAYVEGEMPHDEHAAFEAQLAGDHELRALVEGMIADREALRRLAYESPAAPPFPDDLIDTVKMNQERRMLLDGEPPRLTTADAQPASVTRFRIHRWVTYAALAAVLVICGGVIFISLSDFSLKDEVDQLASGQRSAGRSYDESVVEEGLALKAEPSVPALTEAESVDESAPTSEMMFADARDMEAGGRFDVTEGFAVVTENTRVSDLDAAAEPNTAMANAGDEIAPADGAMSKSGPFTAGAEARYGRESLALADAGESGPAQEAQQVEALAEEQLPEADAYGGYVGAGMDRGESVDEVVVIDVYTDDPDQTNRDLLAWAYSNHATIAPSPTVLRRRLREREDAAPPAAGKGAAAERLGSAVQPTAAPPQEVNLRMNGEQVDELVTHLNTSRLGQQRAEPLVADGELELLRRPELVLQAPALDADQPAEPPTELSQSLGIAPQSSERTEEQIRGGVYRQIQPAPTEQRKRLQQVLLQVRIHDEAVRTDAKADGTEPANSEPAAREEAAPTESSE